MKNILFILHAHNHAQEELASQTNETSVRKCVCVQLNRLLFCIRTSSAVSNTDVSWLNINSANE
jgi:hypothetical protein